MTRSPAPRYSPSQLLQFLASPFAAWLDRQHAADPSSLTPDPRDPLLDVLARRGAEHERRFLEQLRARGLNVVVLGKERGPADTLAALAGTADALYQAPLEGNDFHGYADFLLRESAAGESPARWAVWDAKLTRRARPAALIQLCCYADMLESMTGRRPASLGLILGGGDEARFRTQDGWHYYQRVRRAFLALMARFPRGEPPPPESNADHGRWHGEAERWLLARDHLSQVAGIARSQIDKLEAAGITTLRALAATPLKPVPRLNAETLQRLARQARLQVASIGREQPVYELLPPPTDNPTQGLAALPPASAGDIHFDMEGYPDEAGSLEYLFGAVTVAEGQPVFHDWWAHDAADERRAFEQFVDFCMARWQADPQLHIYHYAAYEPNALKRLMTQYATREAEVDALLRGRVFVDLYTIVRRGAVVGEPGYSLKNVEHLYRPRRAGAVADAGASVAAYDHWRDSGEPRDWRASPLLKGIRDYNEDDCVSTWQLAGWLRERQRESGISYVGGASAPTVGAEAPPTDRDVRRELAEALLAALPPEDPADAVVIERRRVQQLLAWLVEFHRREDKPMWWRWFERQACTEDELRDDLDCLAGLVRVGEPEPVKRSLRFRYTFDPDQDTKLHAGSKVGLVPDIGVKPTIEDFDAEGTLTIKVGTDTLKKRGLDALPARTSLIPDESLSPEPIPTSIATLASTFLATGELPAALRNFLERTPPRLTAGAAGPLRADGEELVAAAVRLARTLEGGCLCLQGPPGTGKTYTGARMILALLADGRSVGVASHSHKAILNLLGEVCRQGGPDVRVTKVVQRGDPDDPVLVQYPQIQRVNSDAFGVEGGRVVGGTAWAFCRDLDPPFDYLIIDEAGQVSVANLVGMARSAKNLILLGDQMQLAQPIQGAHPGESGLSALDYYLAGHATIPPERGLFLDVSRRMHPAVCRFISEAVYEGRLGSSPDTAKRVIMWPSRVGAALAATAATVGAEAPPGREAGIQFIPVEHEGNAQGSDEEVAVIQRLVAELAISEHTERDGRSLGRLDLARDVLVVAPYNLQVRKLRRALPAGMRIGTVDKFQGQEAPVVIVSMCASPREFGSRGLQFLLDPNRLNVAISRAQSLAIVVGDPRLAESPVATVADLQRVNLYAWVQAEAAPTASYSRRSFS